MGQFALEHDVAKLNGAPPGYSGSPDGELAILADPEHPIIVLDEIEKAHPSALVFFLSVFDKGQFKMATGRVIECTSAIFIMTSNIGQELLIQKAEHVRSLSDQARRDFAMQELLPEFLALPYCWRPEFLTRIRTFVPFLPFSSSQQLDAAKLFLKVNLAQRFVCKVC